MPDASNFVPSSGIVVHAESINLADIVCNVSRNDSCA